MGESHPHGFALEYKDPQSTEALLAFVEELFDSTELLPGDPFDELVERRRKIADRVTGGNPESSPPFRSTVRLAERYKPGFMILARVADAEYRVRVCKFHVNVRSEATTPGPMRAAAAEYAERTGGLFVDHDASE